MGRQWAIMRNIPDFKNPDPLRGSRKYQIFSVFGSEQHVFQTIACFVPIIMKNKSDVRFEIELFDVEPDDTM